MDTILYKIKKSYPKHILSFMMSHIICSLLFGVGYLFEYTLIPVNSIFLRLFFSSEIFFLYLNAGLLLLIQSSILSIINFMIDIIFLDGDYKTLGIMKNGHKIEKEDYLRYIILKNIPIFSVLNFVSVVFHKNGISFIEQRMGITYKALKDSSFLGKVLCKTIALMTIIIIVQFTGSVIAVTNDKEIKLVNDIKKLEVVKETTTITLIDKKNGNRLYNLNVYLKDGYIHYNKLKYAKEKTIELLESYSKDILKSFESEKKPLSSFNVMFYNDYTRTWDKLIFDKTISNSYHIKDISSDIRDIDIYIEDNTLIYNLLANINKDEIGWDIAEFMLSEFEDDIKSEDIQENIKKIQGSDTEIEKYIVNILSSEYYENKEHVYYTYVKNTKDKDWYYYDNRFYTLKSKELAFENLLKNHIKYPFTIDFENAYKHGELVVTIDDTKISEEEYNNIYKNIKSEFRTSEEGKEIRNQIRYIGKNQNIILKLNIKESVK